MGCEMESDHQIEEMDVEVLSSMWPKDINEAGRQFNIEIPSADQDMFEEVKINLDTKAVDFKRLAELTNYSEKGSSQLTYLVKNWEYKQENVVRLLREELDNLNKQQQEVELKKLEILEEHRFEEESYGGDKRPISILDEDLKYIYKENLPRKKTDFVVKNQKIEIDAEYDSVIYWKQQTVHLEKLLEASIRREEILREKLQESIENLETQSSPVEELSDILKRADNFLHFILQKAPVVIGHQDQELRYRFIYNHFPSLHEQDIIGKTDMEIFTGAGVKESQDFKREVLERGVPAKREITFDTGLFGLKTFLIYVEPVFSKSGEKLGVNYMGMDVTDQVRKREKMIKLCEEIAVQKAKETELNKTIHITEETMRAKQMLATMSHEIRSPLSGVVSMTEILATSKLDKEQRQLVNVMLSSGDLVLQLINDILDLSKVESGVMKLEATKFRPREVVKHVLQTAAASLQKVLTLEGHVADDVPVEVSGDVLRIRQILTNLISNAIKFTHEGKVGIKLYVVTELPSIPEPPSVPKQSHEQLVSSNQSTISTNKRKEDNCFPGSPTIRDKKRFHGDKVEEASSHINHKDEPNNFIDDTLIQEDKKEQPNQEETTVYICCDVFDTGIGIPDNALPTLFKRYMQVSADTARKYGGTGLGLAICKQLVELMGGHLTVTSKEHQGSTFTFVLPYKVSPVCDSLDDPDELSDMLNTDSTDDGHDDDTYCGFFQFQPRMLGSLFSSHTPGRTQNGYGLNGFPEDACSVAGAVDTVSDVSTSMKHTQDTHKTSKVGRDKQDCNDLTMYNPDFSRTKKFCSGISETRGVQDISDKNSGSCSGNGPEIAKAVSVQPKILLVEDNKVNVMVARSMMKQLGHEMEIVNNGAEAVRAVQRRSYDLVLMDVCMPVMDGHEATRLIRSYEETGNWDAAKNAGVNPPEPLDSSLNCQEFKISTRRLPIVAMTANGVSESSEECFASGMDSFVSKPITFQKLKECLQQYLPP